MYGPDQRELDLSVFKDFLFRERYTISLRGECFNVTNTENFAQPNSTISSFTAAGTPTNAGQFGELTSTTVGAQPKVFQIALQLNF